MYWLLSFWHTGVRAENENNLFSHLYIIAIAVVKAGLLSTREKQAMYTIDQTQGPCRYYCCTYPVCILVETDWCILTSFS